MAPPTTDSKKNILPSHKLTTIDIIGGIFCSVCKTTFPNKKDYEEHYIQHQNISNDISYTCVVCYKQFPNYSRFRGHCYTIHVNKSRFQCKKCAKHFSKQTALEEHEASHNFTCPPPCNQEFSSKQELQMHKRVHKDSGPPYPCHICKEEISNVDTCEMHVDEHAIFTYSCPMCSENFDDKILATKHLSKHFGDDATLLELLEEYPEDCESSGLGGILCCYCDEPFKFKTDFDEHFKNEHEDELLTYTCIICENQYDLYAKFARHCYNHIMRKKFKCENCNKSFSRVSLLVTHVGLCEKPPQPNTVNKPFQCQSCELSFACNWRLTRHMRDIHGEELVRCLEQDCGEEFDTMKKLVLHQQLDHKKIENYCRECGLEFKSLSMCEKHLEVHVKRSYSCPICDKKFGERHLLMLRSQHIQTHFQLAFHVCKTCGKIYSARHRLMMHIKTHTEAKNFDCKTCGKAFAKIDRLNAHMYTHTGERPYKCVACDKAFTSYPNWYKHVKNIHNIDPKTVRHRLPTKHTVKIEGNAYKIEVEEDSEVTQMESSDSSSNVTEAYTDDLDYSGPNLLEDAYMFVQSIDSGNSIALEHIDLSILDDLHRDVPNTSINPNNATAHAFSNVQATNAIVAESSSPQMMQVECSQAIVSANFPREYGPDFINHQGLEESFYNGQIINLDDHILPHIDPMLTIREQNNTQEIYLQNMTTVPFENVQETAGQASQYNQKWEPPIITKIYQNYAFNELPGIASNLQDMYRSVLQTDIY